MKSKNPTKCAKHGAVQFRQGDVLIELVPGGLPRGMAKRDLENGRVILAHGEVTGHAHEVVPAPGATLHEMREAVWLLGDLEDAGTMTQAGMVVTDAEARVIHQEHETIALPVGEFVVRRQREYSPTELRNVAD